MYVMFKYFKLDIKYSIFFENRLVVSRKSCIFAHVIQ